MFRELRKSKWLPIVTGLVSVWAFVTIEVLWMLSVKTAMGR
jgi:hypothetical protein